MKLGKFTHGIAVLLSSVASVFAHGSESKAEPAKTKFSKKSDKSGDDRLFDVSSIAFTPGQLAGNRPEPGQHYPWKSDIVTTVFWIGEKTERQQSGAQSHELMGQGLDKELWRHRRA